MARTKRNHTKQKTRCCEPKGRDEPLCPNVRRRINAKSLDVFIASEPSRDRPEGSKRATSNGLAGAAGKPILRRSFTEAALPFDGADFPERGDGEPRRTASNDTVATIIIVAIAVCLLVTPISVNALVDIIRYIRGH
jgi:hypothetical protein